MEEQQMQRRLAISERTDKAPGKPPEPGLLDPLTPSQTGRRKMQRAESHRRSRGGDGRGLT